MWHRHIWKIESTEEIMPLIMELKRKGIQPNGNVPWTYCERKLKVIYKCAHCEAQKISVINIDN